SSASFSVWAEGSPTISYLWLSNGVSTGITTSNATLNNFAVSTPTIAVAVSNPYGMTTSSVTFAVVAAPPSFTTQPVSAARYTGGPFRFSVATAGRTRLSLQWKTNGVPRAGATCATYRGTADAAGAGSDFC